MSNYAARCVLCSHQTPRHVGEMEAVEVNVAVHTGTVIVTATESATDGVCFKCAMQVVWLWALSAQWLVPDNPLSVSMRLHNFLTRVYKLPRAPIDSALHTIAKVLQHMPDLEERLGAEEALQERITAAMRNVEEAFKAQDTQRALEEIMKMDEADASAWADALEVRSAREAAIMWGANNDCRKPQP